MTDVLFWFFQFRTEEVKDRLAQAPNVVFVVVSNYQLPYISFCSYKHVFSLEIYLFCRILSEVF